MRGQRDGTGRDGTGRPSIGKTGVSNIIISQLTCGNRFPTQKRGLKNNPKGVTMAASSI